MGIVAKLKGVTHDESLAVCACNIVGVHATDFLGSVLRVRSTTTAARRAARVQSRQNRQGLGN